MTAVAQVRQTYWRELRESEKYVAFQDIVRDLDITEKRVTQAISAFQKAWLRQIGDELADAIKEGPVAIDKVTNIAKSMSMGLRKIISREQRTMYTLGELHVQQELMRQQNVVLARRDPPTVQHVIELFKVRAKSGIDAFSQQTQRHVREAALEAWRAYGDSLTAGQMANVIGEALDVSGRQSQLFSRRMGMESFNMGRDRRARLHYDIIQEAEYSALLDGNVCEACAEADGTVTTMDSPEYFRLMPPNHMCRSRKSGFNNCRCMWIYRTRAEGGPVADPATLFKPPAADGSMRVRTGVEV